MSTQESRTITILGLRWEQQEDEDFQPIVRDGNTYRLSKWSAFVGSFCVGSVTHQDDPIAATCWSFCLTGAVRFDICGTVEDAKAQLEAKWEQLLMRLQEVTQ
jgi:hypothetical protein